MIHGKSILKFLLYFIVGGLVVSLTTYYGSKGQGFTAALISMFPSLTAGVMLYLGASFCMSLLR